MPIIACGINHKTAPVALREKVVFHQDKLGLYLQDLLLQENIHEAVLLSTCNRSELYCNTEFNPKIMDWFCRQHAVSASELQSAWYCYYDQDAIQHIMEVACGLDSMILGEQQVLGQLKQAFSESCAAGCIGPYFNRLFQQVFGVAKDIRTNTAIGACPVSIASAAVNLAKQLSSGSLKNTTLLLIGAGDTIQLVLRYLQTLSVKRVLIVNRHRQHAIALTQKFSAESLPFAKLTDALLMADMIISATGSAVPIITKPMLALRQTPLSIIDIAVPRDVAANVIDLPSVTLYSIDDLKMIIQHNLQGREHAAEKAQQVIKQRSHDFMTWVSSLDQVATTIRVCRKQIEDLSAIELEKALRYLQRGDDPARVLMNFAHALTNKLLHNPSIQLRQAGFEGRFELLQLARQLFATPEPKPELL